MKVCLVGCGYWGRNHARVLSELGLLAGCVDTDAERREAIARRFSVPGFASVDDLLSSVPGVAAFVLATPASGHRADAVRLLSAGYHVLVEKPIALTEADMAAISQAAGTSGAVCMAGHLMVFHPAVRHIRDLIRSGHLGEVLYIYTRRTNLGLVRPDVNVLWDLAPHDCAVAAYLLDPKRIGPCRAMGRSVLSPDRADVVFASMGLDDALMNLHVSWLDAVKCRQMMVVGDRRMVMFDDVAQEKVRIYDRGITVDRSGGGEFSTFGEFMIQYRHGDILSVEVPLVEPLRAELEHFVSAITDGTVCETGVSHATTVTRMLEQMDAELGGAPL